jgi:hypothetical protein
VGIRRAAALPTGVAFVATFFFAGFAACGSVPFAAADVPAVSTIVVPPEDLDTA